MGNPVFIYLSNGLYFGFISNGYLYSRDGLCLGWIEGEYVWDLEGKFRGVIREINNNKYILRNRFRLPPISRPSKSPVSSVTPLASPVNVKPIDLSADVIDAFSQ